MKTVFRFLFAFVLCSGLCQPGQTRAEEPSVTAAISSDTAAVGEALQLQITINGAQGTQPPAPSVNGLEIRHMGASSRFEMNNFNVTRSMVHTYSVVPMREGVFTIPAQTVEVNGKKLSTQPIKVTITGAPRAVSGNAGTGGSTNNAQAPVNSPAPGSSGPAEFKDFAFAQWVLPKTTLFVGETIPAELWVCVDQRVRHQFQGVNAVTADGFSVAKWGPPQQRQATKDGRNFVVTILKTAITPVKTGELTLPTLDSAIIAVLPQQGARSLQGKGGLGRLPRGFDAFFNDPFFKDAFDNFPVQQQVLLRPEPVALEVKPLPAAGRPADFSGAIGQFTLEAKAAPSKIRAGDPVTLTTTVKGSGNFDRITAPTVAEMPGWHAYPPGSKFKTEDAAGLVGEKIFDQALVPDGTQPAGQPIALPAVTFSFFNPATGRYETLTGERLTVTVEGASSGVSAASPGNANPPAGSASGSSGGSGAASKAQTSVGSTASPVSADLTGGKKDNPSAHPANDIQYIRTELGSSAAFAPVWKTRGFQWAQIAAFGILSALVFWQRRRAASADGLHARQEQWRQEKARLGNRLRAPETPEPDFYNAARKVLQLETALRAPTVNPDALDATAVCASRPLSAETAQAVRHIFNTHDHLRYAGGNAAPAPVSADARARVLQTLEQFEASAPFRKSDV